MAIPRIWISSLTFSDGTQVDLESDSVVVIVGPNNAGKSAVLRETVAKVRAQTSEGFVVKNVETGRSEATGEEVADWLESIGHRSISSNHPDNPTYSAYGHSVAEAQARRLWGEGRDLQQLTPFLLLHLTAEERLQAANPAENISISDSPTHPIHYLDRDADLELLVGGLFQRAFQSDLIVNRAAGRTVPLHVGERPEPAEGEDRLSTSYRHQLAALPTIQTQGDGMRSFAGVLLHIVVFGHSVILLDEPEAFLHPPQAHLLGQILSRQKPVGRQLFVATHDANIVRGIIDANPERVSIIRLQRESEINRVSLLRPADIATLWSDPILRYSSLLEGVFHEQVLVCEGDADCRFYNAVADSLVDDDPSIHLSDTLYVHAGGKDRIPSLLRALKAAGVPVSVVVDFDVLRSEQPLRKIVEAQGGSWESISSRWSQVQSAVERKSAQLRLADLQREINGALGDVPGDTVPDQTVAVIRGALRRSTPWSEAKRSGRAFVPHGEATEHLNELLASLKALRIFVVEAGELESFVPSVGRHGPAWVNTVIARDLSTDPELRSAREFVAAIFGIAK